MVDDQGGLRRDAPSAARLGTQMSGAGYYHQELSHLVRAHGADPDRFQALALNLGKLRWVHFDTHAALKIAQMPPPDGHTHPELRDPGSEPLWVRGPDGMIDRPVFPDPECPGQPLAHYSPFKGSNYAKGRTSAAYGPWTKARSEHTGLPQTGATPVIDPATDTTDASGRWAELAIAQLRAHLVDLAHPHLDYSRTLIAQLSVPDRWIRRFEEFGWQDPDRVIAEYRNELRHVAAAAASRYRVSRTMLHGARRPGPSRSRARALPQPRATPLRPAAREPEVGR